MKHKTLAFICPRYPAGSTVGGAESLMKHLANVAASLGHTVRFLTTCAEDHVDWTNTLPPGVKSFGPVEVEFFPVNERPNAYEFHRLQTRIGNGNKLSREDQERWMDQSVNSDALIRHLVESGDLYEGIIAGPYLFGLVYHAAQIFPERTLLVPCLHDEPFARQDVILDLFAMVRGAIFNTEAEQQLAERLLDTPPDFGRVVGMGLNPVLDPSVENPAAKNVDGEPYVLYCGRQEPLKGTDLLAAYLDAFVQRTGRTLKWVVTGSGIIDAPTPFASSMIDLGFVSEAEKMKVMQDATVFIHPSTNESLGIVLLEAWLMSTPALVHAGSGVLRQHCEKSQGGLWFRFYPDFEEALLWILDHPEESKAMGLAGKDYTREQYAREAVEQKLNAALEALL